MQADSPNIDRDWEEHYSSGNLPWDSGLPSAELLRVLREHNISPCRALELGCGTGTNAVWLAEQGFEVTAIDVAANALNMARRRAAASKVEVHWLHADIQNLDVEMQPFEFVFDRGCYHCCRRVDLQGYLRALRKLTRPGTRFLCLCGNANEQSESGIPRVTETELREELGELFDFIHLRAMYFEDAGGTRGPLGWSAWMSRKGSELRV